MAFIYGVYKVIKIIITNHLFFLSTKIREIEKRSHLLVLVHKSLILDHKVLRKEIVMPI
jgi:hypothetical protein